MTSTASAISPLWQIAHLDSPVDRLKIRYAVCADKAMAQGNRASWGVLFLNGRSEWIEKYSDLPRDFDFGDSAIWATLDHRGQGASEGDRAHTDNYEAFARDAASVAEQAFQGKPYVILAHSMGGLIALTGVMRGLLHPRAMVLCSPLLGLPNEPLHHTLAKPIARFVSRSFWSKHATGFRSKREASFHQNHLTHSFSGFLKVLESPFPYVAPSFGWVAATFAACDQAFAPAALAKINCPVKLIVGGQERVVDPTAFGKWAHTAQQHSREVAWCRITDGRHELLNEIPRIRSAVIHQAREWFLRADLQLGS